jgi:putative ABC transport system permease protein
MFRNYLKIAISRLMKNKFFPSINIIGLSLGITACLLIMMYVINELSYESFQINRQNIYRVAVKWGTEGNVMKFAGSMPALAPAINEQVPEVEVAVRIRKDYDAIIKNKDGQEIKEENLFFADQGIFDIFSFYLKQGNTRNALSDPYSVVISEKMATKYFGSGDASGKTLLYNDSPLKITGIMHDIPENSHLKCDFLVSYSTLKTMGKIEDHPWNSWGDDLTYILMKKKVPANTIIPKLDELLLKNTNDWFASRMKFEVQPLKEIHWETESRGDLGEKGNKAYVYIFLSAAIFVLMIACFNFLNLSISQFLGRMKEVGIRKTFGAIRNQLIFQFLTESMVIILISALIGVLLFEELYINLYTYLGTVFVLTSSHFLILSSVVLFIVVIIGVIAGGYPASYISRFRPIEILRNETSGLKRKLTFRKLLIMLQFTISIVLLVGTIFIFRQLRFMKNSNLGFTKENVVLVNFQGLKQEVNKKYDVLRDELLKNSNIRYASGAYTVPGINSQMNMGIRPDGTPPDNSVNLQVLPADYGFVKALGLEIIDGRDFSQDYSVDQYESVLLNQAAVAALGLKSPVGTKLFIPGDEYKKGVIVIGVIKDFHIQSFHNKINPIMLYINPKMYICIALKVNPQNINETISYIKKTWTAILPGSNMNFKYLEDAWDNLYSSEKKSGQLLSVFTALALFISCLGLFGFASFIVSKRVKEVGIRKVMGAHVSGISLLLSAQFTFWIIASSVLACPIAYILVKKWLQNFAFRVNINWWIFLVAICFELIISFLTVGLQSWRAATRNPVEALRYE